MIRATRMYQSIIELIKIEKRGVVGRSILIRAGYLIEKRGVVGKSKLTKAGYLIEKRGVVGKSI